MNNFTIEFFETENGTLPAEEFILSQDIKMRAKIFKTLELLEFNGNQLREPFSKHLTEDIYELQTKQGNNISRILYFFFINKKIILTNGFIKKTQKTPKNELQKALKYKKEYLERKK